MFDFLSQKFSSIFSLFRDSTITESKVESALADVRAALIEADVPLDVVTAFVAEIKQDVVGKKLIGKVKAEEQFMKAVYDRTLAFLGGATQSTFTFDIPATVLMLGLQGSGKTTTIGKLAHMLQEQAKKRGKARRILVASVDFYRPAAVDQLALVAKQAGVDFYRAQSAEVLAAAQEILAYSRAQGYELLFLDTAGRLHVDEVLLDELKKLDAIIKPKYKLLVLDAMMGQESLGVARAFDDAVHFTGGIVTKMDSSARAGVVFAFRYALKKPLLFVGAGEKVADLEPFRPERMTSRILGMGDILTLAERADEKIDQEKQKKMTRAFESGNFSLQDFADQIEMVAKLGSLSSLMRFMPGMGNMKISAEQLEKGEEELKKFKAIVSSMTMKERLKPAILTHSRKNRVAKGAGVPVGAIDELLAKFEQSKQFVTLLKKMGPLQSFFK